MNDEPGRQEEAQSAAPSPSDDSAAAPKRANFWLRWIPLLILVAGFAAFFAAGLHRYVSVDELKAHREALTEWVARWGVAAAIVYALFYAVMIAFSIPGGALATMVAGFLFGLYAGAVVVVCGATMGAIAVFLAARKAFRDILRARAGSAIRRMEDGFRRNALSYLLVLRLIPLFPFWLVNLVPAFLGVPLRVYVIGTFFGIMPGTVVYTSVGSGLGAVLDRGGTPDLRIILEPEIFLPILGLAILALLPVAYKWYRGRASGGSP